jgi:hypothetical protein
MIGGGLGVSAVYGNLIAEIIIRGRALISAVRRSSVIFIICVGFSRSLSQSFCLV